MIAAVLAGAFSAASMVLTENSHITTLTLCALCGTVAASLILAASGGLAITTMAVSLRGRAAAFYEAGKLAGSAFGGAALLWLAQHLHSLGLGVAAMLLIALPALFALTVAEPNARSSRHFRQQIGESLRIIRELFQSRSNRWSAFILASPIGTGSAVALLPALAKSYDVNVQQVIWMNGMGGGLALAAGAVSGALLPSHRKRHLTYLAAGVLNALSAAFLFSSARPAVYLAGTLLYLGTTGLCWARFAALVTAIVGSGSATVSTRFAVVAAIGNIPLLYMLLLDGLCAKQWGIHGVLLSEVSGNLLVVGIFFLLFWFQQRLPSLGVVYDV